MYQENSVRCRLGSHNWAWFGPWYGLQAGNRCCKRCGLEQASYMAPGDYWAEWHTTATGQDWETWEERHRLDLTALPFPIATMLTPPAPPARSTPS